MPRDAIVQMRMTIERGPDCCPPTLFAGPPDAVFAGLRAHANTIAHARHVAIEDTYPRTRALIGAEAFHEIAEAHLLERANLRRPIALIGVGFADRLDGAARDLATLEWAWLAAHGAAEARPFDLAAIAGRDAEAVVASRVVLHPATHLLYVGRAVAWDDQDVSGHVLVTRPDANVSLTTVEPSAAAMIAMLDRPTTVADLLDRDSEATTRLIELGALTEDMI